MIGPLEFEPEELDAAMAWHGGQNSMLYAIASTGSLARGSIRPSRVCDACDPLVGCGVCRGKRIPLTDAEWFADLCWRLSSEADETASEAKLRIKRARHARRRDEIEELTAHLEALTAIGEKAERAAIEAEKADA